MKRVRAAGRFNVTIWAGLFLAYLVIFFILAIANRVGDADIELWLATLTLSLLAVLWLRITFWQGMLLWAIQAVCSLILAAVGTQINGYDDPPVLSTLGVLVLGTYVFVPSLLAWLCAFVVRWVIDHFRKRSVLTVE